MRLEVAGWRRGEDRGVLLLRGERVRKDTGSSKEGPECVSTSHVAGFPGKYLENIESTFPLFSCGRI